MNRGKSKRADAAGDAGEPAGRKVNVRFVTLAAFIVLVAGGIVALSMTVPDKPAATTAGRSLPTSIPPPANTTGIQNPRAFQYDPVTDRHWDPNHGHWHPGQPPANATSGTPSSQPSTTTITKGNSTGTPAITNPQPWQYDPATNKHWHPEHGHWHDGPAPAEGSR